MINFSEEMKKWEEELRERLETIKNEDNNLKEHLRVINKKIEIIENRSSELSDDDKKDFEDFAGLSSLYYQKESLNTQLDESKEKNEKEARYIEFLLPRKLTRKDIKAGKTF